jgi:murein DD-endopeptidase MepM/ murein hydrolase activator NlpD
MKRIWYATLLEGVKILVRIKRGVAFLLQKGIHVFAQIDAWVRNTIGFRLYTWQKRLEKYTTWYKKIQGGRMLEFFGQRYVLQIALVFVGLSISFPHSQLYTQDTGIIPGRNTRLYAISGPGDQNFTLEEVIVSTNIAATAEEGRIWNDGAVVRPSTVPVQVESVTQSRSIASISSGGRALIKPSIAPGANESQISNTISGVSTVSSNTTRPVEYTVQSGDVLGSLAEQFGITMETILWANNLTSRSVIRPGDTLTILPTSGVLHTVKSGDTLGRIARLYGAEVGTILEQNSISDETTIQVGQTLVIPGGRRTVSTPVTTPTISSPSRPTSVVTPSVPAPPSTANPSQSGFIWPTSVRTITQYYGWRHTGVDIAGPVGSPLYASKDGTVVTSQCGWNGGYGCYIIIDHGGGVQTLYAHASELYVAVGDTVTQGQTIAAMGSTGRSTGPHIHFEVRIGGRHANPFSYVN